MVKFQRPAVKAAAQATLAQTTANPQKLVLLHTGATLLLSIVLTVLDFLLEQKIGTTGGLSGITTRSALATAQSLLRYVQFLALPAWNCGYLLACLNLSRQQQADGQTLLAGFSRFGPVLRLTLLKAGIYLAIGLVCIYITSAIFMMTPWAAPLLEAMEPMLSSGELSEELLLPAVEAVALPIVLIFCAVFLAACAPVYYMLRLTDFCIMDEEGKGALAALLESVRLTRGNRLALMKLDLSFWWFYALDVLVSLLCYGDLLLPLLGVSLPWSSNVSYFVFLGLFAAAQLLLYAWKKNLVFLTYAHAYSALKTPDAAPTTPSFPWN